MSVMAVYGVCLARKCGDLLICPLSFASAILQPFPVLPNVFCLGLVLWTGARGRGSQLMEGLESRRKGKGRRPFKPTFQRIPVTALGSFFHSAYWEGFFHRGTDSPLKLPPECFWVVWECWPGLVTAQLEVKLSQ